jgi:hypothetical protein
MLGNNEVSARAFALEQSILFHDSRGVDHHQILRTAGQFYDWVSPPAIPTQVSLTFDAPTEPKDTKIMATLNDGQQIVARIAEKDAKGNDVMVPGTWSVDKPELLTMAVAADGMSATFTAVGALGSAVVTLTVGDLPPATASVDVVPGNVATVAMTFDAPTDQTPTPAV